MPDLKPLNPSYQLRLLRVLHFRSKLSHENEQYLKMLEKGYEGESKWRDDLQQLSPKFPILYDVLLEINHTSFQIDALCLTPHKLIALELKNYSGDFLVQDTKWYSPTNKEIKNPHLQIQRNETLLHQFLTKHKLNIAFDYLLVFVHPEFMLYDRTKKQNVILPPQIPRLLRELNQIDIQHSPFHTKIVHTFLSHHKEEMNYARKIDYCTEDLVKGVVCRECSGQMRRASLRKFHCSKCRRNISSYDALSEAIKDFIILFPSEKVTKTAIYDWCGGAISSSAIQRFLQEKYTLNGGGNYFYYH
ncbi:nuclease-related domain-containing protein [Cytobacillus kochii]|uniref:nuclease-related domain-containing protein n=1 Tax=Cytobacillus kochii TaxID=859143 RepID=UPI00402AAC64